MIAARGSAHARRRTARIQAVALLLLTSGGCIDVEGDPQLADVGFVGPESGTTQTASGDKPQSKLWFHDGTWWGVLSLGSEDALVITELDDTGHTWRSTGTVIDERDHARADVLWDGTSLHLVTAGPTAEREAAMRYQRLVYRASDRRYERLGEFPVLVDPLGTESVVLARDSSGAAWIAYTRDQAVMVATSSPDGTSWGRPFTPSVVGAASVTDDDIASIVSFSDGGRGPSIGVMFGNQNDGTYTFAVHEDGTPLDSWRAEQVVQGEQMADDHVNVKAAEIDGRWWIAAALKTSQNEPDDPLILLVVRDPQGRWTSTPYGLVQDRHTRPTVLIDAEHRQVHVFASAPCCAGGRIHRKVASLLAPKFEPGLGEVFMALRTTSTLNNPTTTKQDVGAESGIVVLAEDVATRVYAYNRAALGESDVILDTAVTSGPEIVTHADAATIGFLSTSRSARFECRLDAEPYRACTSPVTLVDVGVGSHTFLVRAIDRSHPDVLDATPSRVEWRRVELLLDDGFDAGLAGWDVTRTNSAQASVIDDPEKSDDPVALFDSDGTPRTEAHARKEFEPRADLIVRVRARVDRAAAPGAHVRLMTVADDSGAALVYVYRQSSDRPGARDDGRIWVRVAGSRFAASERLELGTWHELTLTVATDATGLAQVDLTIDDQPILSSSPVALDTDGLSALIIGYPTAGQDYRMLLDDVEVLA